jgi:hypothetical protein
MGTGSGAEQQTCFRIAISVAPAGDKETSEGKEISQEIPAMHPDLSQIKIYNLPEFPENAPGLLFMSGPPVIKSGDLQPLSLCRHGVL